MERLGPANLSSRNSCKLCDVLLKRGPKSRNQRPARKGIYVHPLCSQHALKPAAPFPTQTQTNPMQNSHSGIIATRSLTNTIIARRTNRHVPY